MAAVEIKEKKRDRGIHIVLLNNKFRNNAGVILRSTALLECVSSVAYTKESEEEWSKREQHLINHYSQGYAKCNKQLSYLKTNKDALDHILKLDPEQVWVFENKFEGKEALNFQTLLSKQMDLVNKSVVLVFGGEATTGSIPTDFIEYLLKQNGEAVKCVTIRTRVHRQGRGENSMNVAAALLYVLGAIEHQIVIT